MAKCKPLRRRGAAGGARLSPTLDDAPYKYHPKPLGSGGAAGNNRGAAWLRGGRKDAAMASRIETIAVRGGEPRKSAYDAVTTPIVCAATYVFEDTKEIFDYFEGRK